jgi:hypothetical protein
MTKPAFVIEYPPLFFKHSISKSKQQIIPDKLFEQATEESQADILPAKECNHLLAPTC